MKHPSDLNIRTILFLRNEGSAEAISLADEIRKADRHLNPYCCHCIHKSTRNRWCKKIEHFVDLYDEKKCFDPTPEYTELTKPLD